MTGASPAPPPAESPPNRPREAVRDLAFLLGTLALALGLAHLTRNDIWYDEAASLCFARQRGLDFFRVFLRENTHGPLYYGLLKLWTWVLGEGDWISQQVTRDALLVDSQRFEELTRSCFLLFR